MIYLSQNSKLRLATVLALITIGTSGLFLFTFPTTIEARRVYVADGDLYRASDVFGTKRLTDNKDIRILFDNIEGRLLLGKGQSGETEGPHAEVGTQLFLANDDGSDEQQLSDAADVKNAFFNTTKDKVFYTTIAGRLKEFDMKTRTVRSLQDSVIHPELSPDGIFMLYEKAPPGWTPNESFDGTPGFAIKNLKTGEERIIPNTNASGDYAPLWAPDGKHVVFFNEGIYVINIDGTNRTKVTTPGDGTNVYGISGSPTWSKNGKILLLNFENEVAAVEFDSNFGKVLKAGRIAFGSEPRWLDDGKSFSVLSADSKAFASELSIVDLDGNVLKGDGSHAVLYKAKRVTPLQATKTTDNDSSVEIQAEQIKLVVKADQGSGNVIRPEQRTPDFGNDLRKAVPDDLVKKAINK